MQLPALGLDVGKYKIHVSLLRAGRKRDKVFSNDAAGHAALLVWLRELAVERAHACMEATGGWSEAIGTMLFDAGHTVSIVNPTRVKAFGKTEFVRTKTDRVDAALIARFCALHQPDPWTPLAPNERLLQGLGRRLDGLIEMRAQEVTRLQAPGLTVPVRESIARVVEVLDAQIVEIERQMRQLIDDDPDLRAKRDLMVTIDGVGERTAQAMLGEVPQLERFRSSKAFAAYLGLSPRLWQSGTLRGRTRLSKAGNAHVRKRLWWPAIVAMRRNAALRRFAERLLAAGKPRMVVIGAVMRKLACLIYAVVRSGRAFDAARAA